MITEKIKELKEFHKEEMDMYSDNVRDHINKHGSAPCDYLTHRLSMVQYHRGAWNALNQLEGII